MKKLIFLASFLLSCPIHFPALAENIPGEIIFAGEERSNAINRDGKKFKKLFDFRFPYLVKTGEIERLYDKWNW